MINSKAPSPIREADYEAIEAALLQSARGRWFLAEFSRRNRGADTRMLLDAIARLETSMLRPHETHQDSGLRRDLIEMAEAISRTRMEIAAMRSSDQEDSRFSNATEELDAIIEATEKATSEILQAAEDVQEVAWLLREEGLDADTCDRLESRATDIYTACSFQDLTGQRTSKVVQVLRYLEKRVVAMIDIWGLDDLEVRQRNIDDERPDAHLLNGPALRGEGVDQAGVDQMLGAGAARGPVIDGNSEAKLDAPPASLPDASDAAARPLAGINDASEFSAPPDLELEELDEAKTQALFS